MAKRQTRRTISLSSDMLDLVNERARDLGKPASQYIHELIAAEMRSAGISPPDHRPLGKSTVVWDERISRWVRPTAYSNGRKIRKAA